MTILDGLGHGVLKKLKLPWLKNMEMNPVVLPGVCKVGIPALFCWDDNDIKKETLRLKYCLLYKW